MPKHVPDTDVDMRAGRVRMATGLNVRKRKE